MTSSFRTQPLPPPSDPDLPHTRVPRPRTQVYPGWSSVPSRASDVPGVLRAQTRRTPRDSDPTSHPQFPASCGSVLPRSPSQFLEVLSLPLRARLSLSPSIPQTPSKIFILAAAAAASGPSGLTRGFHAGYLSSHKAGRRREKAWAVGTCQALASPCAPSLALVSSASSSPSSPPCRLTPQIPTGPLTSWASLSV